MSVGGLVCGLAGTRWLSCCVGKDGAQDGPSVIFMTGVVAVARQNLGLCFSRCAEHGLRYFRYPEPWAPSLSLRRTMGIASPARQNCWRRYSAKLTHGQVCGHIAAHVRHTRGTHAAHTWHTTWHTTRHTANYYSFCTRDKKHI